MSATTSPEVRKHVETLTQVSQCVMSQDFEKLRTLFAAGFVDHNPEWGVSSIEDLTRMSMEIGEKLAANVTLKDMFGVGDKLVAQVSFAGIHKGEAFGFAPTGKSVEWEAVEIYRFDKDGKIAEVWHYSQILLLLVQLGLNLPRENRTF